MKKSKNWLPGDVDEKHAIESMIRVDHAGEYGAVRIYEGQLAVLRKQNVAQLIEHMLDQERDHLSKFNEQIVTRRVRPSALLPLWHIFGFALGAGTAILGEKVAMACTVAVEEVIDEHYAEQIETLKNYPNEKDLKKMFQIFRDQELEHRDTGLSEGADQIRGYSGLSNIVKATSRVAIWLSKRI